MAFEIVSGKSETKAPAPPSSSNHSNIKPKSNNKKVTSVLKYAYTAIP
jgi:hypothetical protein